MEHAQIQTSDGTQVVTLNGQQLQVLQMNSSPHMVQGPNGQQIMVHTVPSGAPAIQIGAPQIQAMVAAPNGQQIQGLQVVPLSSIQGANNNVQTMQLVQTPDGQTFLYQPTQTIDQHQVIHQPAVLNFGNLVQVAQPQQIVNQPNIVMMVNGNNSGATATTEGAAAASTNCAGSDEEPLLYVNARQYKRILKRRAARAKLHEQGRIPKERPKYLHESRHRHAMNRIRGEGGRFNSGSRRNMETQAEDPAKHGIDDVKPDVSITIIQNEEIDEQTNQWRRLAPHPMQSA